MSELLPWAMCVALVVHLGANVAIAVRFARTSAWARAALALVCPPLAGYWAFTRGMRAEAVAWSAGLAGYALGVALA